LRTGREWKREERVSSVAMEEEESELRRNPKEDEEDEDS
jgi:hypothetical protein